MGRYRNEILLERRSGEGYGETMSQGEIESILRSLSSMEYMGLRGKAWQCLVAILWLFGKRISEIVCLRTTDLSIRNEYLAITFSILKKRKRRKDGTPNLTPPPRRTKRITLENPYTQYVVDYWESIKDREMFMFPRKETRTGHIYPKYVWDVIQKLDLPQPVWTHLFRHSLATAMAEDRATAYELKTWFDWEKITTADEYVSSVGLSTKRLSDRKW